MAEPSSESEHVLADDLRVADAMNQLSTSFEASSSLLQKRYFAYKAQKMKKSMPSASIPTNLQSFTTKMREKTLPVESCLSDGARALLNIDSVEFPPVAIPSDARIFSGRLILDWDVISTFYTGGA
jgi:hypothetical protein